RNWYARVSNSLGRDFLKEFETAVSRVVSGPQRGAKHVHGTRLMLLERFPYVIVYCDLEDRIEVIAVQHAKRRPGYWRSRVRG
ncbi:MAG: type II toxin-antitoxin system RelE/ParE family toxin, partial [Planctomycetaceae bacterium]|nr:type II toxin-antitoxin system RelE/ParE family toxin [Planctomycetaceae bacterium]